MEDTPGKKKKTITTTTAPSAQPGVRDDLSGLSFEELNNLLNEVLEQEDYIRAISIRDEINKRKK